MTTVALTSWPWGDGCWWCGKKRTHGSNGESTIMVTITNPNCVGVCVFIWYKIPWEKIYQSMTGFSRSMNVDMHAWRAHKTPQGTILSPSWPSKMSHPVHAIACSNMVWRLARMWISFVIKTQVPRAQVWCPWREQVSWQVQLPNKQRTWPLRHRHHSGLTSPKNRRLCTASKRD